MINRLQPILFLTILLQCSIIFHNPLSHMFQVLRPLTNTQTLNLQTTTNLVHINRSLKIFFLISIDYDLLTHIHNYTTVDTSHHKMPRYGKKISFVNSSTERDLLHSSLIFSSLLAHQVHEENHHQPQPTIFRGRQYVHTACRKLHPQTPRQSRL